MREKIGIFIPTLTGGGAQRVAINLASGLVERGCDVEIIVIREEGALVKSVHPKVDIVSLGAERTALSIPSLSWKMYNDDFDAIISFMGYVNVCAMISQFISFSDHVSILTEHTSVSAHSGAQGGRGYVVQYLSEILYPVADAVVGVSEGVKNDLRKEVNLQDSQVCKVYNPVVTNELHRLANVSVDHPWFGNSEPVILGVGRLIRDKNFELLIRAFQQLNERREARLIILGEGPERSNLEQEVRHQGISDRVDMPGFKRNPYCYMSASDVVVLSSSREGFGNVLVEAMACGTPVVSTDCPSGPSEILEGGKWGPLVPVGDVDKLSDAIQSTLEDPPSSMELKMRSKNFTDEKIAKKYLKIIRNKSISVG